MKVHASRRDRIVISACLVLLAALAWAYLIHLDRSMSAAMQGDRLMAEMGMSMDVPWTPTDAALTFVMWAVMMVAMMTPAAAPVVLLFAATQRSRRADRIPIVTVLFGAGYLLVWTGFSAAAAGGQWALHQAAMLSPAMSTSSAWLGGGILVAAGAYQLTPSKYACLRYCQSPLGFLMTHWREGPSGALHIGVAHGIYCVGCCWALMCVLFVVGVMNLAWVAGLAIFVLVERIGPAGPLFARVSGGVMIVAGALVWTHSLLGLP
jgi:predicted metal-binding membrane protein